MSRTTRSSTPRSLILTGMLTAALAVPSLSHAQTPEGERALLNRVPASGAATSARAFRLAAAYAASAEPVDGGRALIARITFAPPASGDLVEEATRAFARAQITGTSALLGTFNGGQ